MATEFSSVSGGPRVRIAVSSQNDGVTLSVPNKLLLSWHSQVRVKANYLDCLNKNIPGSIFLINRKCTRVANRLAGAASFVKSKDRKLWGRKKMDLRSGSTCLEIRQGETVACSQLLGMVENLQSTVHTQEEKVESLESVVSANQMPLANQGRSVHEVRDRHRRRKLGQLKTAAQRVLWFVETFGLEAEVLRLCSSVTGEEVSLNLCSSSSQASSSAASSSASSPSVSFLSASSSSASSSSASSSSASFSSATSPSASSSSASSSSATYPSASSSSASSLSAPSSFGDSESTQSILQSLYLLERFGVSDQFYHELSMAFPDSPRSYLVKRARTELSNGIDVEAHSPPHHGAVRSFTSTLAAAVAVELKDADPPTTPILVKLSGDGARFSKSSSFILLSFSFPSLATDVLAASGNDTFAVVRGTESYELLSSCFHATFEEVNALIREKSLEVEGKQVKLEFILGSDYKFLLMVMGLNEAHSSYSCIWCNIHRDKSKDGTCQWRKVMWFLEP